MWGRTCRAKTERTLTQHAEKGFGRLDEFISLVLEMMVKISSY